MMSSQELMKSWGEPEPVTRYVLGFLFSPDLEEVVLVEKTKPVWQAGLLNGVGGKIEDGETSVDAMVREFHEETGVHVVGWRPFSKMTGSDWTCDIFAAASSSYDYCVTTTAKDKVTIIKTHDQYDYDVVSNLRWLVPMAINYLETDNEFYTKICYGTNTQ